MRKAVQIFILSIIMLFGFSAPNPEPAQASADAVNETPIALVATGVTSFALDAPKVFWHTAVPSCTPADVQLENAPAVTFSEVISRIAVQGSNKRKLYSQSEACADGKVLSNLATDANYVYWLEVTGLKRLSTNANPGDAPEMMNALLKGWGEVADGGDRIYAYDSAANEISYVLKSNHQKVHLITLNGPAVSLKTDGKYVYYIKAGALTRIDPATVTVKTLVASGVTGYFPERHLTCIGRTCAYTYKVFVAKGRFIYTYDHTSETLSAAIYTNSDTTAIVSELVTDNTNLYFFQSVQSSVCQLFCELTYALYRVSRAGGVPTGSLLVYPPSLDTDPKNLSTDGTFLVWQWGSTVQRLPNTAGASVAANLTVTGIEVTQGIQNLQNGIILVQDKRTFVRVYVKSSGGSVSGVTGLLSAVGKLDEPLQPINPAGTTITVRANPNRNNIDQSFLFELPVSWTHLVLTPLTLHFDINPYKYPLETNYNDNSKETTVAFWASPTLSLELFRLNYKIGGTTYSPRLTTDVLQTFSWILRAYPIGGPVGTYFKPRIWDVDGGTYLGKLVKRTHPDCTDVYDDPKDDVSLCASYFMNGWLDYYREATSDGDLNVGLKPGAFYYGMITDASSYFPRGQAIYDLTSVGPAGIPGQYALGSSAAWDLDNSYADWYAAHEVGHSLGRSHPDSGSDNPNTDARENCGHSRSDPGFPYGDTSHSRAPIGPADNSIEGFDAGDPVFGVPMSVYPSSIWNDLMSYCSNQWISDYTYTSMYVFMFTHPSGPAASDLIQSPSLAGDFLVVSGDIVTATNSADFAFIRRVSSVANKSVNNPAGTYRIRLLGASDQVLANYTFVAEQTIDPAQLSFSQVVDFVPGTRKIQIIRMADAMVLKTKLVSTNAPVVSNVALPGASNPVSGLVTLTWNASDADNDLLSYDVSYSKNSGTTFTPLATNVEEKTIQIDTAMLGGSNTALFRVTASDGINSGFANSAVFAMAYKAPQPYILNPANNTHILYGQLVTLSGVALDAQDNLVDSTGMVWKDANGGILGNGAEISLTTLPVGSNVITLEATNSNNQTGTTTVTIIVDDDLALPGPTLVAAPTLVSWQINPGVSTLQTFDITISNAGSGSLDWTASSDQPWLALSAPSGTVLSSGDPSSLTLTADPAGMLAGQTKIAHVTLTKPASGGIAQQDIVITVSLQMGDVMDQAPQKFNGYRIYTPVVRR